MMTVIQPLPKAQRIPVTDGDSGGMSAESPPLTGASPSSNVAPPATAPGAQVTPRAARPTPPAVATVTAPASAKTLQGIVPPATPVASAVPAAPAVAAPSDNPALSELSLTDTPAETVAVDHVEAPLPSPTDMDLRNMHKTYRVPVEKLARRRTSSHFVIGVVALLILVVIGAVATLILTGNVG